MPDQLISINNSTLELLSGLKLSINSLEMSPIEIDKISLKQFESNFSYGGGELKNTKMKFGIRVDLYWEVDQWCISLFDLEVCTPGGSGVLGLLNWTSEWQNVGNVTVHPGNMLIQIPDLSLKFKSDSLRVSPETKDQPITVDKTDMTKIKMEETVVPGSLPALFGGGTIPIKNPLGTQDMSICNMEINDFSTIGIRLPPFNMTNLYMTDMKISKVESEGFETTGSVQKDSPKLSILGGFIRLWIRATITTTIKTEKMTMNDLQGQVTADSASLSGMHMNLKMKDIRIKNVELEKYDADEIEVGL